MNSAQECLPSRLALAALSLLSGAALAADPYPQPQAYPQQQYPQQGGYPQQQYPQQQFQSQGPDPHPMRSLFASSLAQVAQTTGSTAVIMVADGLTG
ncbi:MAG TPA: hypothetical protein VIV63_10620, partial [Steroidobacteraceae bacterium]